MNSAQDFRRQCEAQAVDHEDKLAQNLANRLQTGFILIDLTKAFEKASHLNLLYKIQKYHLHFQRHMANMPLSSLLIQFFTPLYLQINLDCATVRPSKVTMYLEPEMLFFILEDRSILCLSELLVITLCFFLLSRWFQYSLIE
jgi:hypothetical protein